MEPTITKKDIFRKYAKILQSDESSSQEKQILNPLIPIYSSPVKTTSQPDTLEKFIHLKQTKNSFGTSHMIPYPPKSLQNSFSKIKQNTTNVDTSINSTTAKIFASPSDKNFTGISYIDEKHKDEIEGLPTKSFSRLDHSHSYGQRTFELYDRSDQSIGNISMSKTKRSYNPYAEKDITLEDLYGDAREFSEELKMIVSQEHEQTAKLFTKHLNVKEFINVQKLRVNNVVRVVEKGFVQKIAKENRVKYETWNIVYSELNTIKTNYDDFLFAFENSLSQFSKGKKKIDDPMKIWEGIKMLMEYTSLYTSAQSNSEAQEKLNDLIRKIREFKVEYKLSREFKAPFFEIFEQLESHIKEINQSLDTEKEKVISLTTQREKLLHENQEFQSKNDKLRAEMLDAIQNWKKDLHKPSPQAMPAFQEKYMQEKIEHLQAEVARFAEDNSQLRKDLREAKQEIKRMGIKEEKGPKTSKDKAIMVDLFSKENFTPPTILLSSYISNSDLYRDASPLPKELVSSMVSLIYSDKILVDLCDDSERRPRKTLSNYVQEWFLKKFGVYGFSETLLRDFMYNLNAMNNQDRCRVFKGLLGADLNSPVDTFKHILSSDNQPDKLKMKKTVLCTAEMITQFYHLVETLKALNQKPDALKQENYGPFLPDAGSPHELISNDNAKIFLKRIIREAKVPADEAQDMEYYLYLLQQNEGHNKDSGDGTGLDKYMRFDSFLKFLMEVLIMSHTGMIDQYYTSFKARSGGQKQGALSYEEFIGCVEAIDPDATQAWKDHSFNELMSEYPPSKFPVMKQMESFVKSYLKEDQAKELYQKLQAEKQAKKEATLAKLDKKSSKLNVNEKNSSPTHQNSLLRTNTIKPRLLQSNQEAFAFKDSGLNEEGYFSYDAISSLIVLQETYYMLEEKIILAEKTTEGLLAAHEDFVNTVGLLPKRFAKVGKVDNLSLFSKEELVDYLEQLWAKLRLLIEMAFRK